MLYYCLNFKRIVSASVVNCATIAEYFYFAKALTGGDGAKMEEMRKAFEKGFKMATGTWGQKLPDISQRTYDATEKLFDDYAASLKTNA